MPTPELSIKIDVWRNLIRELKKRGKSICETGAFLLGNTTDKIITGFICYNDLDPHAFDTGIIVFDGDGYIPLWDHCSKNKIKVLADVHTHPGKWTGQSSSDQKYPMIPVAGHIALIIPNYACNKKQLLDGVGIHQFLGKRKWRSLLPEKIKFIK